MSRYRWLAAYLASIVAANMLTDRYGLVPVGFGLYATAGTYAAGFALLARDYAQRTAGRFPTLATMAAACALSIVLASPALALASGLAFTVSELADYAIYTGLAGRSFTARALTSNAVAAPLDTVVFLSVAGFGLSWQVVAGQLVGKLLWATAVPLALAGATRALLRKPVYAADT